MHPKRSVDEGRWKSFPTSMDTVPYLSSPVATKPTTAPATAASGCGLAPHAPLYQPTALYLTTSKQTKPILPRSSLAMPCATHASVQQSWLSIYASISISQTTDSR
mmetsp:Transcript_27992/g.80588  ORF Transcript_27992/g.80588 Transcript_27992/m.80588 type:complete len:106 (-) Transcript_27992:1362-1679(-)